MNCWINLFKPKGITSARAVSCVKRLISKHKIGHTGTLGPEAEGVLPLAIGEATKLVQFLVDAKKEYIFTVKFGFKTDSGDAAGKVTETTINMPSREECYNICESFLGQVIQTPPIFLAIKINGVRSYKLARQNEQPILQPRAIHIYSLKCLGFDRCSNAATYVATVSKGTYIRTLAEDIALPLQSLGFVIELTRTQVGMFRFENSINLSELEKSDLEAARLLLTEKSLRIETILDDIPVLDILEQEMYKIKCGQEFLVSNIDFCTQIWTRHQGNIVAIGSIINHRFISSRVFNN